jgi:arylsulfatase A-like enzyme
MDDAHRHWEARPAQPLFEVRVLGRVGYPLATLPGGTSRLVWPVRIPPGARLRFGYTAAAPRGAPPDARVTFTVSLAGRKGPPLFHATEPLAGLALPKQAVVDLPAGGGAALVFSTTATAPGIAVSWHDPLVLAPEPRPGRNLVILCVDTLRADRSQLFGGGTERLPHLAARMRTGAVFTQAHASSSWSLPSMATILTGQVPGSHNAGRRTFLKETSAPTDWNATPVRGGMDMVISGKLYRFQMLHTSVPTLQEILGNAGYYTAAIHNNGYINYPTRVLKGTDFFVQYEKLDAAEGTDTALRWLEQQKDTRFFLFLHYIDPHQWSLNVPERLRSSNVDDFSAKDRAQVLAAYDALVQHTDQEIERLFQGLERLGLGADTDFIFLADHGEQFFEKGVPGAHGGSFYESVTHVPLAIWGPGVPQRRIDSFVSLADVTPTALDLLGVSASGRAFSGRSLTPLLTGGSLPDRPQVSEFLLWAPREHAAITEGGWKLILDPDGHGDQLYHVAADPHEEVSLIAREPARAARLRRALAEHIRASKRRFDRLEYGETNMDEATYQSLKSLGYIQ